MTRLRQWKSGTVPIDAVIVGDRIRQHVGDVTELAASMSELGLLQPLVVDSKGNLIAGWRRWVVGKQLGWKDIEVTVAHSLNDAAKQLAGERDENTCRLPFTPSEVVALGKKLEELEKPRASARRASGSRDPLKKLNAAGRVRDKVADVASAGRMSGRTYDRAKKVVEAAESAGKSTHG